MPTRPDEIDDTAAREQQASPAAPIVLPRREVPPHPPRRCDALCVPACTGEP